MMTIKPILLTFTTLVFGMLYTPVTTANDEQDELAIKQHLTLSQGMKDERFSRIQFDALGRIQEHKNRILIALDQNGYIFIRNTGLTSYKQFVNFLDSIEMNSNRAFIAGGRTRYCLTSTL